MPRICDRSPCDGLIKALGSYVFGVLTEDKRPDGFFVSVHAEGKPQDIDIKYCPFCGTQIAVVNDILVEQFMRPRRRKITKKAVQAHKSANS